MKAVLVVAGHGTRRVPQNGLSPKEMTYCGDRPALNFAVTECLLAGIEELIFVTNIEKPALNEWISGESDNISKWAKKADKKDIVDACKEISRNVKVTFVYQDVPLGLGHAVLQAEHAVGDSPFLVILPDEVFIPKDIHEPGSRIPYTGLALQELVELGNAGNNGLAAIPVTFKERRSLGIIDYVEAADGAKIPTDMIEKPDPDVAIASTEDGMFLGCVGRYVFQPAIFEILHQVPPTVGNEIQLTSAISEIITDLNSTMEVVTVEEEFRFDVGSHVGHRQLIQHIYALQDEGLNVPTITEARDLGLGFEGPTLGESFPHPVFKAPNNS